MFLFGVSMMKNWTSKTTNGEVYMQNKTNTPEIGQCEAWDFVQTINDDDPPSRQCTNTGILIEETDLHLGRKRWRHVCREHGYDPEYTPPVHRTQ